MQDAGDAHNGLKYPMRPHHQQHLSASGRGGVHGSGQEQSSAAQLYSPMEAVTGAPAYQAPPQASQNPYSSRQSPTRPGSFSASNSYYASRPAAQALPPITPYSSNNNQDYPQSATTQISQLFGNEAKPTRRPLPQAAAPSGRGPVPHFTKVRSVADLQPKINAQPAFRRANPEGGFISVSLTDELLYMDCADLCSHSRCKPSPHTSPPHTVFVTRASNTSPHETPAESSLSQARVPRTTALITMTVIISCTLTIYLAPRRLGIRTATSFSMS